MGEIQASKPYLKIETVIRVFQRYVQDVTDWQEKEYLAPFAAKYIEENTGLPNLYIREVLGRIYDGENST